MSDDAHLRRAVVLARENVERGGQPFGSVIVRDGKVLAEAANAIEATNDPTAHAELLALRAAGAALGSPDLAGAVVYASGHPCPMCYAAMRLAGVTEVVIAYSNQDGAAYGLSSEWLYDEMKHPFGGRMQARFLPVRPDGPDIYDLWRASRPA